MSDRVPYLTSRLQGFGTTIFAEMSALATRTGAVNLGQGFPDYDGPPRCSTPPSPPSATARTSTRRAGASPRCGRRSPATSSGSGGLAYDPDTEVLVTAGATEAIAAACLALCEPGDEVVVLEPTYDSYQASIAMAGARPTFVRLEPPGYRLDAAALRAAVTPRTRLLLVNSPHNPTGTVLDRDELAAVAAVAVEHDLARRHRRGVRAPDLRRRRARPAGHACPGCATARSRSRPAARPSTPPAGRSAGSAPRRPWSRRSPRPSSSSPT